MDTSFLNYIKQSTTLPEQKQAFPLPAPPTSVGPIEQPLKPFSFQGSATPIEPSVRTGLIQSISDQVFSKPLNVNPLEQYNLQGIFYGTPEQIQQQKDNTVKSIMFSQPEVLQQAGVSDDIFGKIAGALGNFAQSAQSYLGETVLPQVQQAAGYTGMAFPQSEFGGIGQQFKLKQEQEAEQKKFNQQLGLKRLEITAASDKEAVDTYNKVITGTDHTEESKAMFQQAFKSLRDNNKLSNQEALQAASPLLVAYRKPDKNNISISLGKEDRLSGQETNKLLDKYKTSQLKITDPFVKQVNTAKTLKKMLSNDNQLAKLGNAKIIDVIRKQGANLSDKEQVMPEEMLSIWSNLKNMATSKLIGKRSEEYRRQLNRLLDWSVENESKNVQSQLSSLDTETAPIIESQSRFDEQASGFFNKQSVGANELIGKAIDDYKQSSKTVLKSVDTNKDQLVSTDGSRVDVYKYFSSGGKPLVIAGNKISNPTQYLAWKKTTKKAK